MVLLCPEGWSFDEYRTSCERQREHMRRRNEEAGKPPLIIVQTWQLALFGEDASLVREVFVGDKES